MLQRRSNKAFDFSSIAQANDDDVTFFSGRCGRDLTRDTCRGDCGQDQGAGTTERLYPFDSFRRTTDGPLNGSRRRSRSAFSNPQPNGEADAGDGLDRDGGGSSAACPARRSRIDEPVDRLRPDDEQGTRRRAPIE